MIACSVEIGTLNWVPALILLDFKLLGPNFQLIDIVGVVERLQSLVDITSMKELSVSNTPLYYSSHEGDNGFLGWHTNCKYPEDRWYFVYNTDEHSSFLRYIKDGKMITKWEPQGWSLNHFTITDCNNPFWHCVYTNSHRFSFGIRPKVNNAVLWYIKDSNWTN